MREWEVTWALFLDILIFKFFSADFLCELGTFSDYFETHLFKYLCNIYYVINTMLGPGDTVVNGINKVVLISVKWLPPLRHYRLPVHGICVSHSHLEGEQTFRLGFKLNVAKLSPLGKKMWMS